MFKITLPRPLGRLDAADPSEGGTGVFSKPGRQSPEAAGFTPAMTMREGACAAAAGMAGIGVAGAGGGVGGITVATHAYQYCMGNGPSWMYM